MLERAFLSESLPSDAPQLEQFWEQTRQLRPAVLDIKPDALGGFRRGDLYNSFRSHITGNNDPVHDIRDIFGDLKDEKLRDLSRRFLKWINYCYYFNQGSMFGLSPSLSSLEAVDIQFARHLAQLRQQDSGAPLISQGFRLPSIDALLTVDPAYIFGIRDSEVGANYFAALAVWQQSPSEEAADALLQALDKSSQV